MEPAREELAAAIESTEFSKPTCPIYQNVVAKAVTNPNEIKKNLMIQLTAPVKWTQSIQAMIADGGTEFIEIGPGKVLQGLMRKIDRSVAASGAEIA
jgi:[acyl-carrier-protein] S-malonyltransferase